MLMTSRIVLADHTEASGRQQFQAGPVASNDDLTVVDCNL